MTILVLSICLKLTCPTVFTASGSGQTTPLTWQSCSPPDPANLHSSGSLSLTPWDGRNPHRIFVHARKPWPTSRTPRSPHRGPWRQPDTSPTPLMSSPKHLHRGAPVRRASPGPARVSLNRLDNPRRPQKRHSITWTCTSMISLRQRKATNGLVARSNASSSKR